EPLAEHHRFAGKHDRWALGIDRLRDAAYAVSSRINRVFEGPSADGGAAGAGWREHPPEVRIVLSARLFLTQQPAGRLQMHPSQRKLTARNRENSGDDNPHERRRCTHHQWRQPRSSEHERYSGGADRGANHGLDHHVPVAWDEERRKKMAIQPRLLRRQRSNNQTRSDDHCEDRDGSGCLDTVALDRVRTNAGWLHESGYMLNRRGSSCLA